MMGPPIAHGRFLVPAGEVEEGQTKLGPSSRRIGLSVFQPMCAASPYYWLPMFQRFSL